jgi:hypothetical protein
MLTAIGLAFMLIGWSIDLLVGKLAGCVVGIINKAGRQAGTQDKQAGARRI